MNFQNVRAYVASADLASLDESVYPILRLYFDLGIKQTAEFSIGEDVFIRLTHKQLVDLPKHVKEVLNDILYYAFLYQKGWKRELTALSNVPNAETPLEILVKKRDTIVTIRKWLEGLKTNHVDRFIFDIIVEALNMDLLIGKPDIKLFEEYLARPRNLTQPFNEQYRSKMEGKESGSGTSWSKMHGLEVTNSFDQGQLLKKYLKLIFEENPEHKQATHFYQYFEKQYVDELFYRVVLAQGKLPDNLHTLLSKNVLEELTAKKELTILDKNKKRFDTKEDVVLKLKVKNVKRITAEVYELSTEKHHLSTESAISDTVSLDFIQPLKQVVKEVEVGTPYKESTVDFSLAGIIENKPSVYIVDFRGEGLTSRAVIRRGSIVALQKLTLTGLEIRFYQEDSTHIDELDLWCNNKRIHVKGKHIIPYGNSN